MANILGEKGKGGRLHMKEIRPAIWLIVVAGVALCAWLVANLGQDEASPVPQPAENAPAPAVERAPTTVPAVKKPAVIATAEDEKKEETKKAADPYRWRKVPWRQGRDRISGSAEDREKAIARMEEIGYKRWEAEEVRKTWDDEMGKVDAELDRISQAEPDRSLYMDRRLLMREAYSNLSETLEEDDYAAARYAANKGNEVSLHSVTNQSPAWEKGLGAGDVILRFNGVRVWDVDQLGVLRESIGPDEIAVITVLQDGRPVDYEFEGGVLGSPVSGHVRP